MSITVKRIRNGKPEFVKVSFWDAIFPPPKGLKPKYEGKPVSQDRNIHFIARYLCWRSPQREEYHETPSASESSIIEVDSSMQCPCCHKLHEQHVTIFEDKKENKSIKIKDTQAATKTDNATDKKTFSTSDPETFSVKDNKTIIKMKEDGASWEVILKAIGKKSKSQIKEHWKTIDPSREGGEGKKDDNDKKEPEDNKEDEKKAVAEKKKAEGLAKAEAKKKEKEAEDQKQKPDKEKNSTNKKKVGLIWPDFGQR